MEVGVSLGGVQARWILSENVKVERNTERLIQYVVADDGVVVKVQGRVDHDILGRHHLHSQFPDHINLAGFSLTLGH